MLQGGTKPSIKKLHSTNVHKLTPQFGTHMVMDFMVMNEDCLLSVLFNLHMLFSYWDLI